MRPKDPFLPGLKPRASRKEPVKLADDGSGDLVVRLYETTGGRADARLTLYFDHAGVRATDLLERPLAEAPALVASSGAPTHVRLGPFELVTLRVTRG
ncbi:glycosyl hydrolase-related protein [Streptomyces sp. H34-S4]|uniref:glycosyl hydrolase-related protein n=1 Tax=Streptomyces sp. H34-S4 TaxID=2996463 RepID=UPI003B636FFA